MMLTANNRNKPTICWVGAALSVSKGNLYRMNFYCYVFSFTVSLIDL